MPEKGTGTKGDVAVKARVRTQKPPLYKVYLMNDDYTPMDFVVHILMAVFRKTQSDAFTTMMSVHKQGKGLAGIYTHEVAETKVAQVEATAMSEGYPLKCSIEPE